MTAAPLSHISSPVERARRYATLRDAMEGAGLDALVVCSRGDEFMRGRVQYVSDIFQWAGWGIVVLPLSGDPSFISDPLWGLARPPLVNWINHILTTQQPGVAIGEILSDHGISNGNVGIVGLADITPAAHYREMVESSPHATFSDATDLFDDVRAIKSQEEIDNLYETSAILRRVFKALEAEIRPGVSEHDVLGEAHRLVRQFGCLDGIAQMSRTPFTAYTFGTKGIIEEDDLIAIDLEWGGPSGYWLELRRVFSFKPPNAQQQRYWESRVESFAACVDAMTVGAESMSILDAMNDVYARYDQTAEGVINYTAHGIGLDSLEPPWVPGKDRVLEENMVINLHCAIKLPPEEASAVGSVTVSDNVLVTADGPVRMTDQVDEWIVLDS
ncbi:MAG: M24 family metallopeptidase [Acidimicrobiales bacterium]|jgi:Xaa-Pro aminopeptidase|nr:M24 family metallopeptidase [Acidimicrobiales bacterium]